MFPPPTPDTPPPFHPGWKQSFFAALAVHGVVVAALLAYDTPLSGHSVRTPPPSDAEPFLVVPVILQAYTPLTPTKISTPRPLPPQLAPVQAVAEPLPPQPEPRDPIAPPDEPVKPPAHPEPQAKTKPHRPNTSAPTPVQSQAKPQPEHSWIAPPQLVAPAKTPAPLPTAPSADEASALMIWQRQVAAIFEQNKRYPRQARLLRQQGVAALQLTIRSDGTIASYILTQASGFDALDDATVALVARVGALPPPPIGSEHQVLVVPLRYQIR